VSSPESYVEKERAAVSVRADVRQVVAVQARATGQSAGDRTRIESSRQGQEGVRDRREAPPAADVPGAPGASLSTRQVLAERMRGTSATSSSNLGLDLDLMSEQSRPQHRLSSPGHPDSAHGRRGGGAVCGGRCSNVAMV